MFARRDRKFNKHLRMWLPQNTWILYKNYLQICLKPLRLTSHLHFLLRCKDNNAIPNGFKYKTKVTYENVKERCQQKLDIASIMSMKYTINSIKKQLQNVKREEDYHQRCFMMIEDSALCDTLTQKIDNILSRAKVKLDNVKERKFHRLPHQDERDYGEIGRDNGDGRRRRRRIRKNHRKRSAKAKRNKRNGKLVNIQREFINKLANVPLPSIDRFTAYDNTNYEMSEVEKQVTAKGLKFVPMIKRANIHKKEEDFRKFARLLRLAVYHHRRGNINNADYVKEPWTPKSNFDPPTLNENLELFINNIHEDMFNPHNFHRINDNMTREERDAMNQMRMWNLDPTNARLFRCQDKGQRLVIEFKERYADKVELFLQDESTFTEDVQDNSNNNKLKVAQWAEK